MGCMLEHCLVNSSEVPPSKRRVFESNSSQGDWQGRQTFILGHPTRSPRVEDPVMHSVIIDTQAYIIPFCSFLLKKSRTGSNQSDMQSPSSFGWVSRIYIYMFIGSKNHLCVPSNWHIPGTLSSSLVRFDILLLAFSLSRNHRSRRTIQFCISNALRHPMHFISRAQQQLISNPIISYKLCRMIAIPIPGPQTIYKSRSQVSLRSYDPQNRSNNLQYLVPPISEDNCTPTVLVKKLFCFGRGHIYGILGRWPSLTALFRPGGIHTPPPLHIYVIHDSFWSSVKASKPDIKSILSPDTTCFWRVPLITITQFVPPGEQGNIILSVFREMCLSQDRGWLKKYHYSPPHCLKLANNLKRGISAHVVSHYQCHSLLIYRQQKVHTIEK